MYDSGAVVSAWSLLIRTQQRACAQAETPPIVLCRFPRPALLSMIAGRALAPLYFRPYSHAPVKIFDILIGQTNAAGGHETADGRWLVGAVDPIFRVAEIHCARTER